MTKPIEEVERECCDTFKGSPHRVTCVKRLGKSPAPDQIAEIERLRAEAADFSRAYGLLVTERDSLRKESDTLREQVRATTYDQPTGERSMGKAVAAFNTITGHTLTEADGWLLMQILKDVRQWSNPAFHQDSAEDCIAYAALKAEALAKS